MNTNFLQSTESTEETNASQTSAIVLKSLLAICDFDQGKSERPPSARRFVTLRASANNVMRKLEVHGLLALAALWRLRRSSGLEFLEFLEILEKGRFQNIQNFQNIQ